MASFSAALLAGGRSVRMGRDKALLTMPGTGRMFWQRQLDLLRELGPEEIFWSGFPRPGLPEELRIIGDAKEDAGPLGGIAACLEVLQSDLLLVLPVDLPRMSAPFLRGLLDRCSTACGAVPCRGDFYEPLAAVYPKALRSLAAEHLDQGRLAMQVFVREALKRKLVEAVPITEMEAPLFQNVNGPQDLEKL